MDVDDDSDQNLDLLPCWIRRHGNLKNGFCAYMIITKTSLLSCQSGVTVMSCFVYKIIRDLESIQL